MQQYYVSDEEIDALWEYFVDQEAATPCVVCGRRVADLSDMSDHPLWKMLSEMALRLCDVRDEG